MKLIRIYLVSKAIRQHEIMLSFFVCRLDIVEYYAKKIANLNILSKKSKKLKLLSCYEFAK